MPFEETKTDPNIASELQNFLTISQKLLSGDYTFLPVWMSLAKNPVADLKLALEQMIQNCSVLSEQTQCVFAQTVLGIIYAYGLGTEPNYLLACSYLNLAIAKNHPEAMNCRAVMYEEGIGEEPNIEKAIALYERAIALKNGNAFCYYAQLLEKRDMHYKAHQLLEHAAFLNHGPAILLLARRYYCDALKHQEAFNLFSRAFQLGHNEAAPYLAWMYEDGRGVKRDVLQAIHYYKIAYQDINCLYLFDLADLYLNEGYIHEALTLYEEESTRRGLQDLIERIDYYIYSKAHQFNLPKAILLLEMILPLMKEISSPTVSSLLPLPASDNQQLIKYLWPYLIRGKSLSESILNYFKKNVLLVVEHLEEKGLTTSKYFMYVLHNSPNHPLRKILNQKIDKKKITHWQYMFKKMHHVDEKRSILLDSAPRQMVQPFALAEISNLIFEFYQPGWKIDLLIIPFIRDRLLELSAGNQFNTQDLSEKSLNIHDSAGQKNEKLTLFLQQQAPNWHTLKKHFNPEKTGFVREKFWTFFNKKEKKPGHAKNIALQLKDIEEQFLDKICSRM